MERIVNDVTVTSDLPGSGIESLGHPIEVTVVFTDPQSTQKALKTAADAASDLDAGIRLIVPQVVSYAAPLELPPVPSHIAEQQFRNFASNANVDTKVDIYLCRSVRDSLLHALKPHSLVVIGSRRRWWPTPEKSLARKLRQAGHDVILTERE